MSRVRCKHCALPSLRGLVAAGSGGNSGFCRFHWAGQLSFTPGAVPPAMREEHARLLAALAGRKLKP